MGFEMGIIWLCDYQTTTMPSRISIHCLIEGHDLHFFAVSQIYAIDVKNELKV